MSEENEQTMARRSRRVKRLKKAIILILILWFVLPVILCVFLGVRIQHMSDGLKRIDSQMEQLLSTVESQEEKIELLKAELLQETQKVGSGVPLTAETGREIAVQVVEPIQQETYEPEEEPMLEEEAKDQECPEGYRKVYLTFDDGPSIYTDDILDILDRYEVKATFFVVGKETEEAKEAIREIVERGHTLGMHSYSHKYAQLYASTDAFAADFEKLRSYLEEVTGVSPVFYRFPGGSSNTVSATSMRKLIDFLDTQEVTYFDWNVACGDGSGQLLSVSQLTNNVMKDMKEFQTSVILLHDSGDKKTTVEALPNIIENILALGDTVFLPITEDTVPVQHIQ